MGYIEKSKFWKKIPLREFLYSFMWENFGNFYFSEAKKNNLEILKKGKK